MLRLKSASISPRLCFQANLGPAGGDVEMKRARDDSGGASPRGGGGGGGAGASGADSDAAMGEPSEGEGLAAEAAEGEKPSLRRWAVGGWAAGLQGGPPCIRAGQCI